MNNLAKILCNKFKGAHTVTQFTHITTNKEDLTHFRDKVVLTTDSKHSHFAYVDFLHQLTLKNRTNQR